MVSVSQNLLRECIVAVCLSCGSTWLFASPDSDEQVSSSAQVDDHSVDYEPSAYALVWSYFGWR
jgi:hypothetical protein